MTRKRDLFQSMVTRRQFLQGAVMGALTLQFPLKSHAVATYPEEHEIVSGSLTALGDGWLEIQEEDRSRRLFVGANTSFWKGGESTPSMLVKGDDIMIRALASQALALRVWSNLSRAKGAIIGVKKNGYILRVGTLHQRQIDLMVEISEHTLFSYRDTIVSGVTDQDKRKIIEGDYMDVIGEQTPGGIRATHIDHFARNSSLDPKTVQQERGKVKITVERNGVNDPQCTYTYSGSATWFNCSNGAGRCGTCSTSRSDQCAWPALDTCGCCSASCCDCSKNCVRQVYLYCGKVISINDACQNKTRTAYIADCGPCQKANCAGCSPELCGRQCVDCKGYYTPIIDLTRPTFAAFGYDPATKGCFSCNLSVTISC